MFILEEIKSLGWLIVGLSMLAFGMFFGDLWTNITDKLWRKKD